MISKRTKIIVLGANAKVVTVMGDAIIFMGGIAVGVIISSVAMIVALATDYMRRMEDRRL